MLLNNKNTCFFVVYGFFENQLFNYQITKKKIKF